MNKVYLISFLIITSLTVWAQEKPLRIEKHEIVDNQQKLVTVDSMVYESDELTVNYRFNVVDGIKSRPAAAIIYLEKDKNNYLIERRVETYHSDSGSFLIDSLWQYNYGIMGQTQKVFRSKTSIFYRDQQTQILTPYSIITGKPTPAGLVNTETTQRFNGSDFENFAHTQYFYNQQETRTQANVSYWFNGKFVPETRSLFITDVSGYRVEQTIHTRYDSTKQVYNPEAMILYEFKNIGFYPYLIKRTTLWYNEQNSNYDTTQKYTYAYLADGSLDFINAYDYSNNQAKWENHWKYVYETIDHISKNPIENTSIYPNPANELIRISPTDEYSEAAIYNLQGQLIWSDSIYNNQISLSSIQEGTYILNLINNKGQRTYIKIIKQLH